MSSKSPQPASAERRLAELGIELLQIVLGNRREQMMGQVKVRVVGAEENT